MACVRGDKGGARCSGKKVRAGYEVATLGGGRKIVSRVIG